MKWIYCEDKERYRNSGNSCDEEGTPAYHEGCHPGIYVVELDDGTEAVRCYECLEGQALVDVDKDINDWFDKEGKYAQ